MAILDDRINFQKKLFDSRLLNSRPINFSVSGKESSIIEKIATDLLQRIYNCPQQKLSQTIDYDRLFVNKVKAYLKESVVSLQTSDTKKVKLGITSRIFPAQLFENLGNVIKPDIVYCIKPALVDKTMHIQLEKENDWVIHKVISCLWTLPKKEYLNGITILNKFHNRKGHLPHIVAVTGEPTLTRIASLALGTGDIDCVYHFALHELKETLDEIQDESQQDMYNMLVEGRRLRDISDLPFDLAV